ncbi:MAG: hypothetical protein GY719_24085 [bacterium]|nr:hypothetical protein [bacterium]
MRRASRKFLIESLIVVLCLLGLLYLAFREAIDMDQHRQRKTVSELNLNMSALAAYREKFDGYPAGDRWQQAAEELVREGFLADVETKDVWGHEYLYRSPRLERSENGRALASGYSLRSCGKDGDCGVSTSRGSFSRQEYERDLVIADGEWTLWPESSGASLKPEYGTVEP